MGRYYDTLFNLELRHTYYTDGLSKDFVIEPLPDAQKLLKNYNCILKSALIPGLKSVSSARVLYQSINSGHVPLTAITSSVRFRFILQLTNPAFLNFTDLVVKTSNTQVFYFSNTGGNLLAEELVDLQPKHFIYNFSSVNNPDELRVFDRDNVEIVALRKTLTGGPAFSVELDLNEYPDAKYKLELFALNVSTGESRMFYFDNALKPSVAFGIVEIYKTSNTFPGNAFRIEFARKTSFWRYFVVVKNGVGGDLYTVVDTGLTPVVFSVVSPPYSNHENDVIGALLEQYPAGGVVLIKSNTKIAYSEAKKASIELRKNGQVSPPLIRHLPNPEIIKPKTEAYVFV
ncbi:MAG: hypothetical protein HYZ14_12575 [Bacteroidetes bacterium]|nr:hypothetical protein [Bacteroidota bacterium]